MLQIIYNYIIIEWKTQQKCNKYTISRGRKAYSDARSGKQKKTERASDIPRKNESRSLLHRKAGLSEILRGTEKTSEFFPAGVKN